MRIISTLLFWFLGFHSSGQLKESIISQLFTTTRPHGMYTDFKVQVCGGGGILLTQPRNFSDLHLPVYKKEETQPPEKKPGPTGNIYVDTMHRVCTRCPAIQKADESKVVVINCWGINKQAIKPAIVDTQSPLQINKKIIDSVTLIAKSSLNKKDTPEYKGVFADTRIVMSCGRSLTDNNQPMLVLDGVPIDLSYINKINPNDIADVMILKSAPATAIYGPDGANGALLITTKKLEFIIRDFLDGSPVAGATVLLISAEKKDTLMFVADDKGIVSTDKLHSSGIYEMKISAVGYGTSKQNFKNDFANRKQTILLSRNIISCGEVVISHTWCPKKISCGYTLNHIITRSEPTPTVDDFQLYPNPASAGASVCIRFNEPNSISTLRVISLDGKTLLQQPVSRTQKSIFRLDTDARWTAGTYFVQLVYENGRVAASGKIIIQ